MCFHNSVVSFFSIIFGSDVNFFSSFFDMNNSFFGYVCFSNFLLGFSMDFNIFSFLVIGISSGFGVISFSFSNMSSVLFEISFNLNGMCLNGSGGSFVSTGVGFSLSIFGVSFSFVGNMGLFLGSFFDLFSSVRFGSGFLGDVSLCFFMISNSDFLSSMNGIMVGLFLCLGGMMMNGFSFFGIMTGFFCNVFIFYMSLLSFGFVCCFFFCNLSFCNFSVVDDFSNNFLFSWRWFYFFNCKVFFFFFHFFFLNFFVDFSFDKIRNWFTMVVCWSSAC